MPATSFCEYTDTQPKVSHQFALGSDRPVFAFADVWRPWTDIRKGELGEHLLFASWRRRRTACSHSGPPETEREATLHRRVRPRRRCLSKQSDLMPTHQPVGLVVARARATLCGVLYTTAGDTISPSCVADARIVHPAE